VLSSVLEPGRDSRLAAGLQVEYVGAARTDVAPSTIRMARNTATFVFNNIFVNMSDSPLVKDWLIQIY
jgi:hypothetical protein